ncbi:MAG TPA: tyrosine-type recombinase/integrase, partial [Ktedonobacteraceae bacterium]
QKNGAVVREAVGHVRLVGVQAYHQLREVYRVLRLVVNCFQPSLKLQAKVPRGEQVHRVYDAAQTPLQRLLASGVLSETRQHEWSRRVEQVDPLALSGYLDVLRRALLCGTHTAVADGEGEFVLPLLRFSLVACTSGPQSVSEERPAQACHREVPWPPERIQGDHSKSLPTVPHLLEEMVSEASQPSTQAQPMYAPPAGTSSSTTGEHKADHLALTTLEQAIAAYVQEMRATGRNPKTLQWHQTSLGALRRYVWRQFHLADIGSLTGASLRTWLTDLSIAPSARTGAMRTVSTVAAYARSARAFCNWLVRQGYVAGMLFPQDAVPQAQRGLPQAVEPEAFVRLLRACQLAGSPGGLNAGVTARNRAILWLLRDTGLHVSELCRLRLADVDRAGGTVTVRGKRGHVRTLPLSTDGQRAVCAYVDQARLTPAWEPAVPEARDRLLLTERRRPLTKNSLTLLFLRLSQRAGFTRKPVCPSMLRDTYAIRFLQAGGALVALQEQLGVADLASVKRYQHCCEQRGQEREAQEYAVRSLPTQPSRRGKRRRLQQR